ncbi:DUF1800 domain-containing protein [Larkinella rosea]|uniref:DUF1800 domain-containing protein n=1 Tax=Larkinella rosea TaxID=2025312 RepID=A0A3P1BFJ5_9BACT|nr:DUF1800 domain-containing protein [Larkinella rosea]RRA99838.1 DUF1800 domain-containing protein [Larkinella rosea]
MKEQGNKQHLFWRAGFGASPHQLREAEHQSTRKVVRALFNDSRDFAPLTVADDDQPAKKELRGLFKEGKLDRATLKDRIRENRESIRDLNVRWMQQMASGRGALREKMALFWHSHFACRNQNNVRMVQQYLNVIREHALGHFGDLLMAISKSPAMLQFLNNQQNRKNAPNENFAREVMELFTLGRANYTEHDIKEAARAFTGWGFNPQGEFVFRRNLHDEGEKTVFGKTGAFQGEDIIRLLLERKETATFVTSKLYRFLVTDEIAENSPDHQRIAHLADQFYRSNYDMAGLLETIFTSDWFYDPKYAGARIKSPVELLAGMQHSLGIQFEQKQPVLYVQRTLGQVLLYPPNVAGWPGGRNWIDSSSLLFRMKLPELILKAGEVTVRPKDDGDVNTELLARKVNRLFASQVDWTAFEKPFQNGTDDHLVDELARYFLPYPLTDPQRNLVVSKVKKDTARSEQIRNLTTAILSLPEYQLC